eukprot:3763961-Amphidinium_carterae.1
MNLKAAYRRLNISPNSLDVSLLAVFDPLADGFKVFQQRSVPFGATASVWHLNRCSLGRVCISNYFDDYSLVEFIGTMHGTGCCCHGPPCKEAVCGGCDFRQCRSLVESSDQEA